MGENVQAAGREIGITEKDIKDLQRRRLVKAFLFGAIPLVTFIAGFLLRKTLIQETSSEIPTSTYPYAAAAALTPLISRGIPSNRIPKKFTVSGMVAFAAVAFMFGFFIPESTPEYMSTRYGVFSR